MIIQEELSSFAKNEETEGFGMYSLFSKTDPVKDTFFYMTIDNSWDYNEISQLCKSINGREMHFGLLVKGETPIECMNLIEKNKVSLTKLRALKIVAECELESSSDILKLQSAGFSKVILSSQSLYKNVR